MINVLEVFNSIAGEVNPWHQGCLATFVRLGGCNLNCSYCDTPHTKDLVTEYDLTHLLSILHLFYQKTGKLCITGGEPLLQPEAVNAFIKAFPNCWIETNGTCDFSNLIGKVTLVADYKLGLIEETPLCFHFLRQTDFIKFVVTNEKDVGEAKKIQQEIQMTGCKCNFAYSPIHEEMSASHLFGYLVQNPLPNTIINVQIHKYLEMK